MKKIILLISIFLLCSCYDYKEVNEIDIITGVGIDYKDDEYIVTLEILNPSTKDDFDTDKTTIVTNSDSSFAHAIQGTYTKIKKYPNFSQLQMLIVSLDTIKEAGLQEIFDVLFRSSRIGNTFYVCVVDDANLALNTKQKKDTVSNTILGVLQNSNSEAFITDDNQFDYLISRIMATGEDVYLPGIKIQNNKFAVDDLILLNNYDYSDTLKSNNATIISLLTTNVKNNIFINDGINAIDINKSDYKYKIDKDKVTINLNIEGTIKSLDSKYSLRDPSTFHDLEIIFEDYLKEKTEENISLLKDKNCDVLGIGNKYYKKYPKLYYDNLFKDIDIDINIDVNLTAFGTLYEVIE